jgi:3-oxoadipate enol-lactonase
MPTTNGSGFPIHWETQGDPDAPPLLLIMGMGFSSRGWEALPERLARSFRVITFDNRWTGRSRMNGASTLQRLASRMFRISDLADDTASVLDAVGWPAFVFGVSMGGMIAQELALRHPARVRGLALGATFADYVGADHPRFEVMMDLVVASAMATAHGQTRMGRHLVSGEFLRSSEARFVAWLKNAEFGGRRLALSQMAAIAGHSTIDRLSKIDVPTLVITGDDDRLVPPSNSKRIAELISGSRLELLSGAGHVFPLEREDETVALLEAHFRK